jgi:hypothetical protein
LEGKSPNFHEVYHEDFVRDPDMVLQHVIPGQLII